MVWKPAEGVRLQVVTIAALRGNAASTKTSDRAHIGSCLFAVCGTTQEAPRKAAATATVGEASKRNNVRPGSTGGGWEEDRNDAQQRHRQGSKGKVRRQGETLPEPVTVASTSTSCSPLNATCHGTDFQCHPKSSICFLAAVVIAFCAVDVQRQKHRT